jgi:Cu(I)/Ag(I) efflux system membrane protein CusA/SilA
VIKWRRLVIFVAAALVIWVFFPWNKVVAHLPDGKVKEWAFQVGRIFPYQNLGSEFMPPLYEGDLLYMPHHFSWHLPNQSARGASGY